MTKVGIIDGMGRMGALLAAALTSQGYGTRVIDGRFLDVKPPGKAKRKAKRIRKVWYMVDSPEVKAMSK